MTNGERRLLVVGFSAAELAHYRPVLDVGITSLEVSATGADAAARASVSPFACVVIRHPSGTVYLPGLVAALRAPGGASRAAGVVVVASPEAVAAAEALKGHGVNKVLSTADGPELLGCVVMRLESVNLRHAERVPTRLDVEWDLGGGITRATTINLSLRGMLVELGAPPRTGAVLSFRLHLPDQTAAVEGDARVVRSTIEEKEGVRGFAARFLTFSGDAKVRLEAFLDTRR